ncbi:MAG: hypothetical protein ABI906_03165 [Pseudomonadota bacterium]
MEHREVVLQAAHGVQGALAEAAPGAEEVEHVGPPGSGHAAANVGAGLHRGVGGQRQGGRIEAPGGGVPRPLPLGGAAPGDLGRIGGTGLASLAGHFGQIPRRRRSRSTSLIGGAAGPRMAAAWAGQ